MFHILSIHISHESDISACTTRRLPYPRDVEDTFTTAAQMTTVYTLIPSYQALNLTLNHPWED